MPTFAETAHPEIATQQQGPAAELVNATKRYRNGVVALDGLSLRLGRGEVVALLGPNGAGKSTAVKLLMGLSAPTAGSVRVFGADPRARAARARIGVMLQVGRAPEMLRVREHLAMFRSYFEQPMPMPALIAAAALEGLEDRKFGELSGGQKQRVLFALALAGNPDLVFLDEPTVGLDIEARRAMWTQIRALAAQGKTVLLTTHYLEEADALASRIVVVNKGRVVCEGTPAQVKAMGAGMAAGAGTPAEASGAEVKLIRCRTRLHKDALLAMPGVLQVTAADAAQEGNAHGAVVVTSSQPEATMRRMLLLDDALSGLEIAAPALEDAFLALTRYAR